MDNFLCSDLDKKNFSRQWQWLEGTPPCLKKGGGRTHPSRKNMRGTGRGLAPLIQLLRMDLKQNLHCSVKSNFFHSYLVKITKLLINNSRRRGGGAKSRPDFWIQEITIMINENKLFLTEPSVSRVSSSRWTIQSSSPSTLTSSSTNRSRRL